MPTDQLLHPFNGDADMDRALRDLLPPMPRSTAWEAHQRDALLTFIQTGDVRAERTTPASVDAAIITVEAPSPNDRRRRAVVVLGMAAAAVLLIAGLVIAPRWVSQEVPPAVQPATPDGVAPFPDRYPVLPAGHPMESRVTARFDGQFDWSNEPRSWMIVGRVVDDVVEQAVRISSSSASPAEVGAQLTGSPAAEPVDGLGDGWSLYRNVDDVMNVAVGRLGPATLTIAGADPVGVIDALGGLGFVDISVDAQGEPFLGVTSLPDGYRLIAGPESFVPGAMSAKLTIPDGEGAPDPTMPDPVGDEGDGITVYVDTVDPFLMPFEGLARVDIGGVDGWVSTTSGAPMVTWKVSETTWATVWDAADTDAALAFARSLEFVDRATWTQRYAVPEPQYPAGRSPAALPTVPSVTADELLFPDLFPILPDDHPLADQATAMYGGMTGWENSTMTQALVAIDDGGRLSEAVLLQVHTKVTPGMWGSLDAEAITVAGVTGTLYTERDPIETETFVVHGEPTLVVQALDPVAFVDAAGGVPIVDVEVGAGGSPMFAVGTLPEGYDVVVQPGEAFADGTVDASTRVPDGAGGGDVSFFVQRGNAVVSWALKGETERIDIEGRTAWRVDRGPSTTVFWQVSDDTWVLLVGTTDADLALDIARSVEFVDRTSWEQRYGVELRNYPTREEWEMIPATTAPSLIALEEIGGLPTDVPISCGSTPPRDELVDVPAVAATPQEALAAFIETVEPGLWPDGWIHTWNGEDDDPQHRFDYRRDDGQLVTVVYVDAVDGGWAATRWLSTPC